LYIRADVEILSVAGTSADAVDVLKLAAPPGDTSALGVVTFDGRSVSLDVKQADVFGADGLARQFTIATWLRHKRGDDDRVKQHVVCSSDAEGQRLLHAVEIWLACVELLLSAFSASTLCAAKNAAYTRLPSVGFRS